MQFPVLVKCITDVTQEARPDDASASPHECDSGIVKLPVILGSCCTEKHVALCIRYDLGCVQGIFDIFKRVCAVATERGYVRSAEGLGCCDTFLLHRRKGPCKDSLRDEGDGYTDVEGGEDGPLSGSLLHGSVHDLVDQRGTVGVLVPENVSCNLDEITVQLTLVPL